MSETRKTITVEQKVDELQGVIARLTAERDELREALEQALFVLKRAREGVYEDALDRDTAIEKLEALVAKGETDGS